MKKILLLILLLSLFANFVCADAVPPWMKIHVYSDDKSIPFQEWYVSALNCVKSNISSQTFVINNTVPYLNISVYDSEKDCFWISDHSMNICRENGCEVYEGVPYKSEFKLAVYVPSMSKVFVSKILKTNVGMNEFYIDLSNSSVKFPGDISLIQDVEVRVPSKNFDFLTNIFLALIVTLIFELFFAWIYLSIAKIKKKVLLSVVFANVISVPLVWALLYSANYLPFETLSLLIFAEIFAVVFEAVFIRLLDKKLISLRQSFILSLLMNLGSLLLGGLILTALVIFSLI